MKDLIHKSNSVVFWLVSITLIVMYVSASVATAMSIAFAVLPVVGEKMSIVVAVTLYLSISRSLRFVTMDLIDLIGKMFRSV